MSRQQGLLLTVAVLGLIMAVRLIPWPDRTGRVQVTGTVYLDGSPLSVIRGSCVCFVSAETKIGAVGDKTSAGLIDQAGRYRVDAVHRGDGIEPGIYRVSVKAWSRVPGWNDDDSMAPLPPSAIPERYSDALTSDITVEVTPERSQTIDIKLTK